MRIEHPDITTTMLTGYPYPISEALETCASCSATLRRGDDVAQFKNAFYCDNECLTNAFSDNPEAFGAETVTLDD